MNNKTSHKENWLTPTLIAIVILILMYFFVLFPKDVTTVFYQYITYVAYFVIGLLSVFLIVIFAYRSSEDKSAQKAVNSDKNEKKIEHLIWRNRYVLQATKNKLLSEGTSDSQKLWLKEKALFSKKYIFPIVPEEIVPFHRVSELIEKSIGGGSIRGTRPPTYNVHHE